MMEPGGIGILRSVLSITFDTEQSLFWIRADSRSYQHHSVEEPAFLLGMAFPNNEVTT